MKVKTPQDIFKSILYHLSGVKYDSTKACYILNDYFEKGISKEIKHAPSVNKYFFEFIFRILVID